MGICCVCGRWYVGVDSVSRDVCYPPPNPLTSSSSSRLGIVRKHTLLSLRSVGPCEGAYSGGIGKLIPYFMCGDLLCLWVEGSKGKIPYTAHPEQSKNHHQ